MQNAKFKIQNLFLIIIILGSLVLPLVSLAGVYNINGDVVDYQGLVPCGTVVCVNGKWDEGVCGGTATSAPCQFCHLFVTIDGVIDFLLTRILFPIALLMLVIAGIFYIGAAFEFLPGGFNSLSQAKEIIGSVVVGLLIILFGYFVLSAFLSAVGLADWTRDIYARGVININCPIVKAPASSLTPVYTACAGSDPAQTAQNPAQRSTE